MSEKRKREQRVREEHHQSPVAQYFKEVVYGGIDGIITTFAVVAGFSGAALSTETTTQLSFLIVLLFGLANLLADGVSMGLGNFLSVRSDQNLYCRIRAKKYTEIERRPDEECAETVLILQKRGFSHEDAVEIAARYRKNPSYWTDFMMNHGRKISNPTDDNPVLTGLATFCSFVFFGFIPLIPFILFVSSEPHTVFIFSSIGALCALILLGVLKWHVTQMSLPRAVAEVVLVGGVAATVAFFVGSLFML